MTELKRIEVGNAVIEFAEPEPWAKTRSKALTRVEFTELMTLTEQAAIYEAEDNNMLVRVFVERLRLSEGIRLDDLRTIEGVRALEAAGLLAEGRADEILGITSAGADGATAEE